MSQTSRTTLSDYLGTKFGSGDSTPARLPAPDEVHVRWWRDRQASQGGTAEALVTALPQFQVPIEEGASGSDRYAGLIRRGEAPDHVPPVEEVFAEPDRVRWTVLDHPAGGLPVATLSDRGDFERAFRALGSRCEPVPVGPNVHALYVSGLPSPVRLRETRSSFLDSGGSPRDWPDEMRRMMASDATSFHDRLILLHPAPYGGLPASRVDPRMDETMWIEASSRLRLEHEFTHHATHRLLGSYRLHAHDEVLADLMGFTAAIGRFDADLFLEGLGIDGDRALPDARLRTYLGDLDPEDLPGLVEVLRRAARNVEEISPRFVAGTELDRLVNLMAMASIDLATLADRGGEQLAAMIDRAKIPGKQEDSERP